MEKRVIIVNGRGGVGKDTLCALAARDYRVRNISSITPILEIARFAGWDGEKTPAARRLLSQLKQAFTEWNDLSFQYCMAQYAAFLQSEDEILFVHIRETAEIERFRQAVGADCQTLLVRRQAVEQTGPLGNHADDDVSHYHYDYYFYNDGPLDGLEDNVRCFFAQILQNTLPKDAFTWHYR